MSAEGHLAERIDQLETEVRTAVKRLTTLEEQIRRLGHTIDQLRSDYAESPDTLENA